MSEMVGAIKVVMVGKCGECGEYVPEDTLVDGECEECARWTRIMAIERPVYLSDEEMKNLNWTVIDYD